MADKIILHITSSSNMKKIVKLLGAGLPKQMSSALEYLVTGKCDETIDSVVRHVEGRRQEIAGQGDREIPIWYSPKPGSAGDDTGFNARPEPGKTLNFTMKRIAATGKDKRWGIVLYLIARDFQSNTIFELGACAGISAMYLASAPSVEKLITVEGSEALSEIAKESLKEYKCARVVNGLFDDAIDSELPTLGSQVDFAYIDGHHEKVATIHYFNRILPFLKSGAVVVFDDISWSYDMREAWEILAKRPEFSHTLDLGAIGVCILKTVSDDKQTEAKYWDLQPILGKAKIGNPHGWKK
ncbi:MAG: class I SAM-dependent methyltransferase [FCB group bacterium]|nr:class I SAM-dependent methyltransferase [FCB group bacterium]